MYLRLLVFLILEDLGVRNVLDIYFRDRYYRNVDTDNVMTAGRIYADVVGSGLMPEWWTFIGYILISEVGRKSELICFHNIYQMSLWGAYLNQASIYYIPFPLSFKNKWYYHFYRSTEYSSKLLLISLKFIVKLCLRNLILIIMVL